MSSDTTASNEPEADPSNSLPTAPSGSKFIELPESGFTLRYADTGSSDSVEDRLGLVTFVLLHGFAGVLETWDFLTPLLLGGMPNARVVAPDVVGSGYSDKPLEGSEFDYSYRSQGRVISELISVLGLSRVVLVGHSSGSVVAAATAVQTRTNSDESTRVVGGAVFLANALFRPKPAFYTDPSQAPVLRGMIEKMMSDRRASMEKMHMPAHAERVLTEEFVEAFAAPTRLPNFLDALVRTVMAKEAPYEELVDDLLSQPGGSPVPMLFVYGSNDPEKPTFEEQKETMRQKLDAMDAELREQQRVDDIKLDDCFHYPQHEQPEALAKAILGFVEKSVVF